uniref:MBL fold metallo-hydrolase n=1 Tax=Ignisphaera aggregans TaxID=334771 RepID=A0A7C2ZQ26_9CREN
MVKVVFLGVGGWVSEPYLGHTSILIQYSNKAILIDVGEGTYRALKYCGYDLNFIEGLVITHRHGDHILGLPTIVLMALYKGINRIRVVANDDVISASEALFSSIGLRHLINSIEFIKAHPYKVTELGPFKMRFIEARHTVPALSVRIDVDNKCIAYSGDTTYNPKLAEFIQNCDVLIHEVSNYSTNAYLYGHSNYMEALDIASKANVKIFVPIHFYQQPLPIDVSMLSQKIKLFVPLPCSQLDI